MSNKKSNTKKTIKKDEKISSVIEVKEKDNKLVYILIIVILVLLSLLIYSFFFNKKEECETKCSAPVIEIEVDPKYQLINYEGFRFKMPLNWDFVSEKNEYKIADIDSTIFISLDYVDKDFDSFASNEYQSIFLENIQTSDNIKIEQSKKIDNYYMYEGIMNNYNYMIIAIGDTQKTILVKAQFIDKPTFDKLKQDVIDFSLSGIKKSDN